MTTAGYLDIQIDQGADFVLPFQLIGPDRNPVSLSLATVRGKIRAKPQDADPIIAFTGTVTDGPEGEGQVSLTGVETATIPVDNSPAGQRKLTQYLFDIEIVFSDGFIQRILEGNCFVSPEVSR